MTTRFYLSDVVASAQSPAFDASWGGTSGATRKKMYVTKISEAIALSASITLPNTAGVSTAGANGLARQYLSNPIAAQTILSSGTLESQLLMLEGGAAANIDGAVTAVKVVSNNGGTVRGTLLAYGQSGTHPNEFLNTGARNVKVILVSTAITQVAAQDGDRILFEFGAITSLGGTGTPLFKMKLGDNATDLPVDDTTTTDGAGWLEFSQNLTFLGPTDGTGAAVFAGTAILAGAGALTGTGAAALAGTATLAGAGALAGTGAASFTGTATLAGAGALAGTGAASFTGTAAISANDALVGAGAVAFAGSATLNGFAPSSVGAAAFAGTATLSGAGALAGTGTETFDGTAILAGAGALAGTGAVAYGGTAALAGAGALAGTGATTLAGSAALTGAGALAGLGAAVFGGSAAMQALAAISGTGHIVFAGGGFPVSSFRVQMGIGIGI